jgi:Na+-driven multidrug efflux pump
MGAVVECLKRYLLAQQVVLPGMVITIITSCLCPLYNWLLIFKWVPAPRGGWLLHIVFMELCG